jgi:hypothetical protein
MLFRVDFGLIAVSKLYMWCWNFTCCFKTTLQMSEITHCHVGKTGYFVYVLFHSLSCYFEHSLVSFWLCIMLFQNHTVWLRKYTPCGNNLIPYSSNYFYSMTCVVETVTCGFRFVSCGFERHCVASTFYYVISKMMCCVSKIHMSSREIVVF